MVNEGSIQQELLDEQRRDELVKQNIRASIQVHDRAFAESIVRKIIAERGLAMSVMQFE